MKHDYFRVLHVFFNFLFMVFSGYYFRYKLEDHPPSTYGDPKGYG